MNYIPVGYYRLRQKIQYGTVVLVAFGLMLWVYIARALFNPAPERYIDQGNGHCVAVGLKGKIFPCQDPRFVGVNMDPTYVPPGTKIEDLQRMSEK